MLSRVLVLLHIYCGCILPVCFLKAESDETTEIYLERCGLQIKRRNKQSALLFYRGWLLVTWKRIEVCAENRVCAYGNCWFWRLIAIGHNVAGGYSHIAMAQVCQGNQSTWRICVTNTPGRLRCDPRSNPIYYGPQAKIGWLGGTNIQWFGKRLFAFISGPCPLAWSSFLMFYLSYVLNLFI